VTGARTIGARLLGCIFTGAHPDGSGFSEEDAPNFDFRHNNCSFYSGSKALGEEILRGAESCYIGECVSRSTRLTTRVTT